MPSGEDGGDVRCTAGHANWTMRSCLAGWFTSLICYLATIEGLAEISDADLSFAGFLLTPCSYLKSGASTLRRAQTRKGPKMVSQFFQSLEGRTFLSASLKEPSPQLPADIA